MKKSVWLHNIRSVYNVGSIFRTADALGVDHIYLSGYTPQPIDRFGRQRQDFAKISLGAEQSISWSSLDRPLEDIEDLIAKGAYLVAVEQDEKSILLNEFKKGENIQELILAMGEEVSGMKQSQLELAHEIVEIPMQGDKESLNVSVAFGIVGYAVFSG